MLLAAAGRQLSQADGAAHSAELHLCLWLRSKALLSRGLSSRGLARGGSLRVDARAASEGRAADTVRRVHSHAGAVECSWWSVDDIMTFLASHGTFATTSLLDSSAPRLVLDSSCCKRSSQS